MTYSLARFQAVMEAQFRRITDLVALKGGEYAAGTDRLANFRKAAQAEELPMTTIWKIYAGKHWDAIGQYIKDERTGTARERAEPISGRIDDMIVYLLLLQAMVEESSLPEGYAYGFEQKPPLPEPEILREILAKQR